MDGKDKAPGEVERSDRERETFWRLLYRYLWPFQYFRDATVGDRQQQQSNYRHNRAMRFCLPGFMLKWSVLSVHWFAWGNFLDGALSLTLLVAGCFVAATLALIMVLLLGLDWLWLGHFPERF